MTKETKDQPVVQHVGFSPKASIGFTLHVQLDDGTTKDIACVGTPVVNTIQE